MSSIIETKVYLFSELSDSSKEKAREWYRNVSDFDSKEWIYEEADSVAESFGLNIERSHWRNQKGLQIDTDPKIYYSGFWSQGDGACFEGTYNYKKGALKACPQDPELHRIIKGLQKVQKKHLYKLRAECTHRGHYNHSGCMQVEVYHSEDEYRSIGESEQDITDLLRSFADWIYKQLEEAYEWENADEQVDANIIANEYTFTEDGVRF